MLKQNQYVPQTLAEQVTIIFAGTQGLLDDMPTEHIQAFEAHFHALLREKYTDILHDIQSTGKMEDATEEKLTKAVQEAKDTFKPEGAED